MLLELNHFRIQIYLQFHLALLAVLANLVVLLQFYCLAIASTELCELVYFHPTENKTCSILDLILGDCPKPLQVVILFDLGFTCGSVSWTKTHNFWIFVEFSLKINLFVRKNLGVANIHILITFA